MSKNSLPNYDDLAQPTFISDVGPTSMVMNNLEYPWSVFPTNKLCYAGIVPILLTPSMSLDRLVERGFYEFHCSIELDEHRRFDCKVGFAYRTSVIDMIKWLYTSDFVAEDPETPNEFIIIRRDVVDTYSRHSQTEVCSYLESLKLKI